MDLGRIGIWTGHLDAQPVGAAQEAEPLTTMRTDLAAMDAAASMAVPPSTEPVPVLAALRPKMLELSKTHAAGTHPYLVPPEHTADAHLDACADHVSLQVLGDSFETLPTEAWRELAPAFGLS